MAFARVIYDCITPNATDALQSHVRAGCISGVTFIRIDHIFEGSSRRAQDGPYPPRERSGNTQAIILGIVKDVPGLCTQRHKQHLEIAKLRLTENQFVNLASYLSRLKKKGYVTKDEKDKLGGFYISDKGEKWLLRYHEAHEAGETSHRIASPPEPAKPSPIWSRSPAKSRPYRHPSGKEASTFVLEHLRTHTLHYNAIAGLLEGLGFLRLTAISATVSLVNKGWAERDKKTRIYTITKLGQQHLNAIPNRERTNGSGHHQAV